MKDLIEKLEKASGPSRELDGLIWIAIDGIRNTENWKSPPAIPLTDYLREAAPKFTESVDVALRVNPGWFWRAGSGAQEAGWAHLNRLHLSHCDQVDESHGIGATPAIAICIAGLRARSQRPNHDRSEGGQQ